VVSDCPLPTSIPFWQTILRPLVVCVDIFDADNIFSGALKWKFFGRGFNHPWGGMWPHTHGSNFRARAKITTVDTELVSADFRQIVDFFFRHWCGWDIILGVTLEWPVGMWTLTCLRHYSGCDFRVAWDRIFFGTKYPLQRNTPKKVKSSIQMQLKHSKYLLRHEN